MLAAEHRGSDLDGAALQGAQASAALWETVPPAFRRQRFTAEAMGGHPSFCFEGRQGTPGGVCTDRLPAAMTQELAYCLWRTAEQGLLIDRSHAHLVSWIERVNEDRVAVGMAPYRSLAELSLERWRDEFAKAHLRRGLKLEGAKSPAWRSALTRCYRHLELAYDERQWWERDRWSPNYDPRIPVREHEPTRSEVSLDFCCLRQPWLREGAKWYLRICLETRRYVFATFCSRLCSLRVFSDFLARRGIDDPRLALDHAGVRLVALDFLGAVRQLRVKSGRRAGEPLSDGSVHNVLYHVESFYAFMAESRHEAAAALGDRRWLSLGTEHAPLWREGEKPKEASKWGPREDAHFDAVTMGQAKAHAGLLGAAKSDGGFGDPQAMRMLLLFIATGRRASEIRLMDYDCLLPIDGVNENADSEAMVAKLRYQQTKIEGAPDTIYVDSEVVAIVREQQRYVAAWVRETLKDPAARPPKYLFLAPHYNQRGLRPYPASSLSQCLRRFSARVAITDGQGRPVSLGQVGRFRHTKATTLLNAGVPIHVVQRYMGHLSPTMTMHYAKTLRESHEREFLRFRKITADARELQMDPRDLYALLELDKRTDRVLPNGLCMLPPRQACQRGNACLTCEKFTTDASYLPEHETQLQKLGELIEVRQRAFRAKTGEEMSPQNVWLSQRLSEKRALEKIIEALEAESLQDGKQAIRAAGVDARPAAQPQS